MGSCGSSVRARPGGMCPSGTGRGPRFTPVFAGGRRTARSSGCSAPPRRRRTLPATSTGWCRSTPPSSAPTSMPPGPEKGAQQPGPRTLPRRPDQQDSSGLRRCGPPARLHRHKRQHQRLPPVHRCVGGNPGAPHGPGATPDAALACPGRQGLQLQGHPRLAAEARDQPHHPRAGRPGPQPSEPRQPRRTTPGFDHSIHKRCNVVERCFNKLKQWRGIATRYDKTTESYQAAVTLAALLMWA